MKREDRFIPVDVEACPWVQSTLPNGEPKGIQYRRLLPGQDGLPHVIYSRYEPNWTEVRHRHPEDEILILVKGDITIEGVTYRAPTSIYVGRGTLYGPLTAGPDGVEFYRVAWTEEMLRPRAASENA